MNNKHRTVFATTWGFRGVIMVNHPWERLILASYPCLRLSTFLIHLALFFVRSLHFSLITSHTFHSTVFLYCNGHKKSSSHLLQKTSYPIEIFFCWRKGFKFNRNLLSNDQETVHIIQSRVFCFLRGCKCNTKADD